VVAEEDELAMWTSRQELAGDWYPNLWSRGLSGGRSFATKAARPVNDEVRPAVGDTELLAEVRRLELELERYRQHAQRTSRLFLSATNYADWVRENARRDAELALRKARARVDKLTRTARDLERTERELVRAQEGLVRLQALTDQTRARLSAFLEAGLQVLDSELPDEERPSSALDLQHALRVRLPSDAGEAPVQVDEVDGPAL